MSSKEIQSPIMTQQQMIDMNNAIKKLPEKKARDLLTYSMIRLTEFEILAKLLMDKKVIIKKDLEKITKKINSKKKIDEFIKKLEQK